LGTSFLATERTNLYLNYLLENDRTDSGVPVHQGSVVTGVKQKLSDSSSVYLEERYHDAGSQSGLTHAAGVNLVEKERWNIGASAEVGTLLDSQTSAQTDRKAAGVRLGYNRDSLQLTSAVEYRRDDAEQPDQAQGGRRSDGRPGRPLGKRRQVRRPPGTGESRAHQSGGLQRHPASRGVACRLALLQRLGGHDRGANARAPGCQSTPERRAGRD